jgi:hypothetical protein
MDRTSDVTNLTCGKGVQIRGADVADVQMFCGFSPFFPPQYPRLVLPQGQQAEKTQREGA